MKKAKSLYPRCTAIFKFEIDFREIGSSGNVFIYVRGTAAESERKLLDKIDIDTEQDIDHFEKEIDKLSKQIEELTLQQEKIPKSVLQLHEFLGK